MGKVYLSQFNFKNYMGADTINVQNNYQTPAYLEELSLDNSDNIYLSKKTGLRYDYLVTTEGEDQVYVNSNLVGFCRDLTELKETDFLNKDIVNYRLAYNMHTAFSNCYQLSGSPVSARNVRSMYGTYYNCQALTGRAAVNANVNNLIGTYYNCNSITTVPHTTENARMMIDTFYNCTNLEGSPTDADLAVSMQNAYYNCYLLEGNPANCNSAIITVNAYYNCPNIYGNFYWCNRDFDQAEKIRAVNMFYNRDTSKRLNIFIRRDSAVENALLNYSDTLGNIYGAGGITWTPYPVSAEYPTYYYNTLYNTNIVILENVVMMSSFNLARYVGIAFKTTFNSDNNYNTPDIPRYNNAYVNIEKHFLWNIVQNVEDIPTGYTFDHYLNSSSGHPINVYKKEIDTSMTIRNNYYCEWENRYRYHFVNIKTIYYIISTEGYDFAECYLPNYYIMPEQLRLTNHPYIDVNNIFNTDKVIYMDRTYIGSFRRDYYDNNNILAISPKKVAIMNYVYAEIPGALQGDYSSYYNQGYYNLGIYNNFYYFNNITNQYVRMQSANSNSTSRLLCDLICEDPNIIFTKKGYGSRSMPKPYIIPACGPNVKTMNYTYQNTNLIQHQAVCGPNVVNYIGAYYGCTGPVKPYFGPNVINAYCAFGSSSIMENKYYLAKNIQYADGTYYRATNNLWNNLNNIVFSNNIIRLDSCFSPDADIELESNQRNIYLDEYNYLTYIEYYPYWGYLISSLPDAHLVNISETTLLNTILDTSCLFTLQTNLISPLNFYNEIYSTNITLMYGGCNNLVCFNGPYSNTMFGICFGDTNLRYIENTPINNALDYTCSFYFCNNLFNNIVINNAKSLIGTFGFCDNLFNIIIKNGYGIPSANNSMRNTLFIGRCIEGCNNLYGFIIQNLQNINLIQGREPKYWVYYPQSKNTNLRNKSGLINEMTTSQNSFLYNAYNVIHILCGQNNSNNLCITLNIGNDVRYISHIYNTEGQYPRWDTIYHYGNYNLIEIAPVVSGLLPLQNSNINHCNNLPYLSLQLHTSTPFNNGVNELVKNTYISDCSNLQYIYLVPNNINHSLGNSGCNILYSNLINLQKIVYTKPSNIVDLWSAGKIMSYCNNCPQLQYLVTFENNIRNIWSNFNNFSIYLGEIDTPSSYVAYSNCNNLIDVTDIPYDLFMVPQSPDGNRSYAPFIDIYGNLTNFTSQNLKRLYVSFYMDYYGNQEEGQFTIFNNVNNLNLYNLNTISINSYALRRGRIKLFNNCRITNINPTLDYFLYHVSDSCFTQSVNIDHSNFNILTLNNFLIADEYLNYNNVFLRGTSSGSLYSFYHNYWGNNSYINSLDTDFFVGCSSLRFNTIEDIVNFANNVNINNLYLDGYTATPETLFMRIECIDYNNFDNYIDNQFQHINLTWYGTSSRDELNQHYKHLYKTKYYKVNSSNIYKNYFINITKTVKKDLYIPCEPYGRLAFIRDLSGSYYFTVTTPEAMRATIAPMGVKEGYSTESIYPYSTGQEFNYLKKSFYFNCIYNYENYYGYNINNLNIVFLPESMYTNYNTTQNYLHYGVDRWIDENICLNIHQTDGISNTIYAKVMESKMYINGIKAAVSNGAGLDTVNLASVVAQNTIIPFSISPEYGFIYSFEDSSINKQRVGLFGGQTSFSIDRTTICETSWININYKYTGNNYNTRRDLTPYSERDSFTLIRNTLNNSFLNTNFINMRERIYRVRAYNSARNLNVYWYEYCLNFYPYEET